ncbi:hypothetical protein, partial [Xanthomonas sacchari]|uniref:hypothetical protein n=1 Tax=Xanthomonas sacchari TaxID=56458 RepID=UPI003D2F9817
MIVLVVFAALVVLALPLLSIVALVGQSRLRQRLAALEAQVARMAAATPAAATDRADSAAAAAEGQAAVAEPEPEAE